MHTTAPCIICGKPVDGVAYACTACADRAARHLATIADLADDARAVAHGQTSRGPSAGGGSGERRLPVNLAATSRLDAVTNAITTWARHVASERGLPLPIGGDPLEVAARRLVGQTEWMRHRPEVVEFAADVAAAERVLTALLDGPGSRRYLGPCGADTDDGGRCDGDVYARDGSSSGACRTCGERWPVADRRAWLDGEVRAGYFTAADIERAYGIKAGTIRVWAHRGKVCPLLEPLDEGVEGPWEVWRDDQDRPRYPLGPVLDRAAKEAARRAGEQAKRARRAEQREHAEGEVDDAA